MGWAGCGPAAVQKGALAGTRHTKDTLKAVALWGGGGVQAASRALESGPFPATHRVTSGELRGCTGLGDPICKVGTGFHTCEVALT